MRRAVEHQEDPLSWHGKEVRRLSADVECSAVRKLRLAHMTHPSYTQCCILNWDFLRAGVVGMFLLLLVIRRTTWTINAQQTNKYKVACAIWLKSVSRVIVHSTMKLGHPRRQWEG